MTEVSTGLHGARSSVGYSTRPKVVRGPNDSLVRRSGGLTLNQKSLFQGLTSPEYEIGFWPKTPIPFETFQLA